MEGLPMLHLVSHLLNICPCFRIQCSQPRTLHLSLSMRLILYPPFFFSSRPAYTADALKVSPSGNTLLLHAVRQGLASVVSFWAVDARWGPPLLPKLLAALPQEAGTAAGEAPRAVLGLVQLLVRSWGFLWMELGSCQYCLAEAAGSNAKGAHPRFQSGLPSCGFLQAWQGAGKVDGGG
jgi:hypothetical protein